MVRAAAAGVIDYTRADPTNNSWRIKHKLLLQEMQRQQDHDMLAHLHRHWCAYLAHGALTQESFDSVKESSSLLLQDLKNSVFPWAAKKPEKLAGGDNNATGPKNSKIDAETRALIERYKIWRAEETAKKGEQK